MDNILSINIQNNVDHFSCRSSKGDDSHAKAHPQTQGSSAEGSGEGCHDTAQVPASSGLEAESLTIFDELSQFYLNMVFINIGW